MSSLTNRLNTRIAVYGKVKCENDFGETDYKFDKIKSVWSEVIPLSGAVKNSEGNVTYVEKNYKVTIRENSIPELDDTMYFMYKGNKYNINYFQPNFKHRDRIEVFVELEE